MCPVWKGEGEWRSAAGTKHFSWLVLHQSAMAFTHTSWELYQLAISSFLFHPSIHPSWKSIHNRNPFSIHLLKWKGKLFYSLSLWNAWLEKKNLLLIQMGNQTKSFNQGQTVLQFSATSAWSPITPHAEINSINDPTQRFLVAWSLKSLSDSSGTSLQFWFISSMSSVHCLKPVLVTQY